MPIPRRQILVTALALSLPTARAQSPSYPSRPIRLVVPFPAGGALDVIVRVIAERMGAALNQSIVVEPMPGGGSVLATQHIIRQPPDGYAMLVLTTSAAIKSAVVKPPFDIRKDLGMVGQFTSSPLFLAVNNQVQARSVQELIDYARANPGKLNVSSYGVGTLGHLAAELFMHQANVKMVHIPYAGAAASAMALVQGTTQVTFDTFATLGPHQEKGSIRLLAVTTPFRSSDAPEVLTLRETGLAQFNVDIWGGVAVPAGTAPEIVDKLNKALTVALKDPATLAFLKRAGMSTPNEPSTPQGFSALVAQNVDTFGRLIREARLDVE